MKVLYTNFHKAYGGGHDTYLKNLLTNKDIEAYVAVPGSSNLYLALHSEPEKYNIKRLYAMEFPGKLGELNKIIETAVKIRDIIDTNAIDIVHCSGSADHRMMLYVKMLTHRPFKVVFTKHNSYPTKGLVSRWRLLGFSDAVIFVSHSIYDTIGFKTKSKKITVVHNGIDVNRFDPKNITPRILLAKKATPDNVVTFVSNAGTATFKGWHYLFNAVKELSLEQQRRIRIIMVGDMPPAEVIEKYVGALPLCDIAWTGFTAIPEQYLWLGDVGFVLSDDCETISFACREMMAAGLPVIVSDFGGTKENLISHHTQVYGYVTNEGQLIPPSDKLYKNGWLVKVGDIQEIKKTLISILSLAGEVTQRAKQAYKYAHKEFTVEKMINETMNVYRDVLK